MNLDVNPRDSYITSSKAKNIDIKIDQCNGQEVTEMKMFKPAKNFSFRDHTNSLEEQEELHVNEVPVNDDSLQKYLEPYNTINNN